MVPFRGTFDHTLDAKNRLTVPARYRAALAEGVVLAMPVDLKPCVGVWHPEEYERYSEHAQLNKEVVVVGVGDRLELWSKDSWNEHRPALLSGVAEITANVDDTA